MSDISSQPGKPELKQPHTSDGSELVPAEVQANQRHDNRDTDTSVRPPVISGSTVDDEGLLNNFAVEPKIYPSEYPSPSQQRRYIYWGIAATLLVASLVLISKFVS
jgi:hypothetical protein